MDLFSSIGSVIFSLGVALSGFFGFHQAPAPIATSTPTFGAALPSATASFETSLASPITSSATSMTLTANSVRGGGSISGYNCFIVDEGSAQAETICGTVSGTAVSSLSRGISQSTGTTTVAALQFSHRRGANVKISDFPVIQILKAQNNGEDTFPNILRYTSQSAASFTGGNDIVNRTYVDTLAFGAIPAASETASGFAELSTQIETASSTSSGSAARLAIPASVATSTYNAATAPLRVVVTNNTGKIDNNFILSTPPGTLSAYASTTAPTGWLLADGSAVSRTTYADLYSVIGTSYGAGNGATTFNLPDIRGRAIVMASTTQSTALGLSRDTLGDVGTTTTHTLTTSEMPAHTHSLGLQSDSAFGGGGGQGYVSGSSNSGSTGGGTAHNILDPYIVLNYIIKF